MSQGGYLRRIWIKRANRGPMDEVGQAVAKAGVGLEGNANRGGKRQVTLIENEKWEKIMSELAAQLDPGVRRANLLVEGVDLFQSRGKTLQVGDCVIEIWGETRPCERMDEALPGLRDAMDGQWRGGAFGQVLVDGTIRVGDPVGWKS